MGASKFNLWGRGGGVQIFLKQLRAKEITKHLVGPTLPLIFKVRQSEQQEKKVSWDYNISVSL